MAFSNTVLKAGTLGNGWAFEYGTFDGASVTTGTITAGAGSLFPSNTAKVGLVVNWAYASDGDSAAITAARDAGASTLKLTFASSDTGTYYIAGPSSGA